jgi:hypothetical protein
MSGVATAVVAGAVISGVVASKNAKKAAAAQRAGQDVASGEQRRQFDITQGNIQPSIDTGNLAREQLAASLGLSGEEAEQKFLESFKESSGQKFLRERAERALLRNTSAIGGLGGGNVRSALVEQGIGIAGQRLSERQNRLAALSGSGQTAATNLGSIGQSSANNLSNIALRSGESRATGIMNRNQAIQSGISGVTTGLAQSGIFNQQSNAGTTLPASNIDPFARTA